MLNIPPELNLVAFQTSICRSFLLSNLLDHFECEGIRPLARDKTLFLYEKSVDALATKFFAKAHNQEDMCKRGTQFYGEALTQLAIVLENPESIQTVTPVLASFFLLLYEVSKICCPLASRSSPLSC